MVISIDIVLSPLWERFKETSTVSDFLRTRFLGSGLRTRFEAEAVVVRARGETGEGGSDSLTLGQLGLGGGVLSGTGLEVTTSALFGLQISGQSWLAGEVEIWHSWFGGASISGSFWALRNKMGSVIWSVQPWSWILTPPFSNEFAVPAEALCHQTE